VHVVEDNNPPTIIPESPGLTPQGRPFFRLLVRDADSGLSAIRGLEEAINAQVYVAPFTAGTREPVVVTITKIDPRRTSLVGLQAADVSGKVAIYTTDLPNPKPALNSLSPNSITAGRGAFRLTVSGSGFVDGATVRWNGADRATTFVSSTQLTAEITATDGARAGSASITVFNPVAPGGGSSNALTLTVTPTAELRVRITTDRGSVETGQNPAYFVGEPIAIKFRVDGAAQALVTIEDVLPDGRVQIFFRQTVPGNQPLQLNARITPPLGRESLRLTAQASEQTAKDQCSFTVFAAGGAPCTGGELLVRHAYSECNSDGFWHVVEDAYYACPPNGQITRFRVYDKKTEQRCGAGQVAPNPIGTLFKVAEETCQAPVKVGTVVITECRNGLWDHATYTLFECLDRSRRISRTPESIVTTGVRCSDAPPPLAIER
jgi:hypothetical protein